jgi:hypothetical protein
MPSTLDFDQPDWRSTLRPDGLRWDDPSMAERPT